MAVGGWETKFWRYHGSTHNLYFLLRFLFVFILFYFYILPFFLCITVGGPGGYSFLSSDCSRYGFNEACSGLANIFLFP